MGGYLFMREVTKDEFYEVIGNKDIVSSILYPYNYPYTSIYKLRHSQKEFGRIVNFKFSEVRMHPITTKYYLC